MRGGKGNKLAGVNAEWEVLGEEPYARTVCRLKVLSIWYNNMLAQILCRRHKGASINAGRGKGSEPSTEAVMSPRHKAKEPRHK